MAKVQNPLSYLELGINGRRISLFMKFIPKRTRPICNGSVFVNICEFYRATAV